MASDSVCCSEGFAVGEPAFLTCHADIPSAAARTECQGLAGAVESPALCDAQKPCNKPKSCDPSVLWRSATVQVRPLGAVPRRHAKTVRGMLPDGPQSNLDLDVILVWLLICTHDPLEHVLSQSNEVTDSKWNDPAPEVWD